jgi:hypothetical protein
VSGDDELTNREMSDQGVLRQKVREAIKTGTLPRSLPERTWGGRGTGACCTICGEPVQRDEVEFELEFARGNGNGGRDNVRVHLRCFAAWEIECQDFLEHQDLETAPTIGCRNSGGTGSSRVLPAAGSNGTMAACECEPAIRRGPA